MIRWEDLPHNFPRSETEILNNKNKFLDSILKVTSKRDHTLEGIYITKEKERNLVKNWTKELILLSIADLLDGEGNIKFQLLDLLNWQHIPYCYEIDKINDIVCSYVATINEQVMVNASQKIQQNGNTYAAICFYINKHYETWVAEMISETQKPKDYASSAYSYVESLLTDEKYNQENFREFISAFIELEIVSRSRQIVYLWLEIMFQVAISKQRFDIFNEIFSVTSKYLKEMDLDSRQRWQYNYCIEYRKQRTLKESNMGEEKLKVYAAIADLKSEDARVKIQSQGLDEKSDVGPQAKLELPIQGQVDLKMKPAAEKNVEAKEINPNEQNATVIDEKDYVIVPSGGPSEEMPLPSYSGMIAYGFSFFKQIHEADLPGKIYNSMPSINYFSAK